MLVRTIEELDQMEPEKVRKLIPDKYNLEEWIVSNTREWLLFTKHGDYIVRKSEAPLNDGSVLVLEGILTLGELIMEFVSPGEGVGLFSVSGGIIYIEIGIDKKEARKLLGKPLKTKKTRKVDIFKYQYCDLIFNAGYVNTIYFRPPCDITNSDVIEILGTPTDYGLSMEYRWERYPGIQINYDNEYNIVNDIIIYEEDK